jgi:hypothetical protein
MGVWRNAVVGFSQDPIVFNPGFDITRSASQTSFTTSDVQTLNVTATARQEMPYLDIIVRVAEDAYVNPTITSPTTTGKVIYLSDNHRELRIRTNNPVIDTSYTYIVKINVALKSGVTTVDYMPRVSGQWSDSPPTTRVGITSSFSHVEPGVGTWTWSATGNYSWDWHEGTSRGVNLTNYTKTGGTISGHVYESDGETGIANVQVNTVDAATLQSVVGTRTGNDGSYTLINLPPKSYLVQARPSNTGLPYADEYYDNTYSRLLATAVVVKALEDTPNINFSLEPGAIISGVVRTADSTPLAGASVGVVPYLSTRISSGSIGATVPTGQTEFQFQVASLNFHSDSYDWLVVAGARAQFKGTGTINGAGSYRFMLTAIDGNLLANGSGTDKFRIRIWSGDDASKGLVYDNQAGASDTTDPTTVIGGGSIVVHK